MNKHFKKLRIAAQQAHDLILIGEWEVIGENIYGDVYWNNLTGELLSQEYDGFYELMKLETL